MKLTVAQPSTSILYLPNIDFPKFTLITGLNGAGKSQLLTQINDKKIQTDLHLSVNEIGFFTFYNLNPGASGSHNVGGVSLELDQVRKTLSASRGMALNELDRIVIGKDTLKEFIGNPNKIISAKIDDLIVKGLSLDEAEKICTQVKELSSRYEGLPSQSVSFPQISRAPPAILKLAKALRKPAILVDEDDVQLENLADFQSKSIFEQQLAQTFVQHMEADKVWRLRELEALKTHQKIQRPEFTAPWDLLNKVFSEAGLQFTINTPHPIEPLQFYPFLTKPGSKTKIDLNQLSSGEKILVALALSVYQVSSSKDSLTFPKLMLFDELDAVLHPSMIRYYLQIIQKTFVNDLKMHVIAITHSPTTVALAPEESLYLMNDGIDTSQDRIRKISKSEALNILTVGVPTIAINFDNRRQLFVEDESDAKLYQSIYDRIKPSMKSDRTLSFLAVGTTKFNYKGEEHPVATGCSVVKDLIKRLTDSGNRSVWGLVDWDKGESVPNGRLNIFAQDKRFSIENAILDPRVLIAIFHMDKDLRKDLPKLGLDEETATRDLLNIDKDKIQNAIYKLTNQIIVSFKKSEVIEVHYEDEVQFKIPKDYLHKNGHELEELLRQKFGALKRHDGDGGLKRYIVEEVFREFPTIIPTDFFVCFKKILEAEAH